MRWLVCAVLAAAACEKETPPAPPPPPPAPRFPAAVAVVYEGQEIFMGNDEIETDENARYEGALRIIQAAFEHDPPGASLPSGSQGVLLSYSDRVVVRRSMGPVERITKDAFGDQSTYLGLYGANAVAGLTAGIEELEKVDAHRRVLIWIGQYRFTSNDQPAVENIAKRIERDHIDAVALTFNTGTTVDGPYQPPRFPIQRSVLANLPALEDTLAKVWAQPQ